MPVHEVNAEVSMTGYYFELHILTPPSQYPLDLDDAFITETTIISPPRASYLDPPTSMSVAIHVFKSRFLWARIHTELLSDMAIEFSGREERILRMRSDIEEWMATRPPVPEHSPSALVLFGCEDWFSTNYSFSILLLYRSKLTDQSTSNTTDQVFLDCFAAAGNVCRRYRRQFVGRNVGYTWQALHFLFLAGLTYLHCLWTSPAVRQSAQHDEVSSTASHCTMLLVVMAERWAGVAPYRDLFEALAGRTMTMLVERGRQVEEGSEGIGRGCVGEGEDLDWSQWLEVIADAGMSTAVDKLLTGLMPG